MARDKQTDAEATPNDDGTDAAPVMSKQELARQDMMHNDVSASAFDDDALAGITDLQSAMALMQESGAAIESISDYGNGFRILDDKRQLIGQPFVIVQWRFTAGDYSGFVSAAVVTEDGRKLILNDGSTGIRDQLMQVTKKREGMRHANPQAGLLCREGLRVSDYTFVDANDGQEKPASTFYLAQ